MENEEVLISKELIRKIIIGLKYPATYLSWDIIDELEKKIKEDYDADH